MVTAGDVDNSGSGGDVSGSGSGVDDSDSGSDVDGKLPCVRDASNALHVAQNIF